MTGSQRDKAEAAFGHMQHAASEMIAAAHDALEIVDQVVTSADLGEILDAFNHLTRSLLKRTRPATADPSTRAGERERKPHEEPPNGPTGPVQRIAVR
ncbi:MAG: hypothetical protein QOF30_1083 [Acidimicrobiaceae bacterium]|nr:hypothetical protein [Acidimicrobiaceae bacterium]